MKNIYLLPTDKPSRLFYNVGGALLFTKWDNYNGVHIYITSDEEIKEGDWFLDDNNSIGQSYKLSHVQFANPKKIILTTDRELNKAGVWGIADDILEWYVKNPTCEYVELIGYAVVLPGESCDCDNKCDTCKEEETNGCIGSNGVSDPNLNEIQLNQPKQKTLEDINTRYHQTAYGNLIKELTKQENTAEYIDRHIVEAMVEVAKQKMYSEEEAINIFFLGRESLHKALVTKEEALDIIKTNKLWQVIQQQI